MLCVFVFVDAKLPTELQGVNLAGVDMSERDLSRHNLTGANLTGANLSGSVLTGAILANAVLTGKWLDCSHVCQSSLQMPSCRPSCSKST